MKEMTMAHKHSLLAACSAVLLAAAPAFAQTNTPPASTGAGNTPHTPTKNAPAPAAGMDMKSSKAQMPEHPMHKSAMAHHHMMDSAKNAGAQDAAVDHLNDQSYQAAQAGHSFDVSGGSTGMSGGSMSNGSGMPAAGPSGTGSSKM
jgi:hypothetical protein